MTTPISKPNRIDNIVTSAGDAALAADAAHRIELIVNKHRAPDRDWSQHRPEQGCDRDQPSVALRGEAGGSGDGLLMLSVRCLSPKPQPN